ncbi:MAG: ABC transporter permease subunit [Treponema sp.]|nr:ABC transporter permease subunit [Treponema sp.]
MKQKIFIEHTALFRIKRDFRLHKGLFVMIIPVLLFYALFHYAPIYGAIIAFKDFSPGRGILGSPWIGFKNFLQFFNSVNFTRVVGNTLAINMLALLFGFPAPIILALVINEVANPAFKRITQTAVYLPYFISMIVVCALVKDFVSISGIFNVIRRLMGLDEVNLLLVPKFFRTIYVASNIWQYAGWNSIIYLAAISAVDPQLYEAAIIDGAGRFRRLLHVTIPGIAPAIIVLFILRLGEIMNVGFEKIILLYNPGIYSTADVISSFVYRRGLLEMNYSFSAAVGLFNSVINFIIVVTANTIARHVGESRLW